MACLGCGRGFHAECETNCITCHPDIIAEANLLPTRNPGSQNGVVGQPVKDSEKVRDRLSTGRKRAALLYPIIKTDPCEWQGKKNCGGGPQPIVGCRDGMQRHRHHGPVKDTLRNEPGNVHRICTNCHARWHGVNDDIYDPVLYNTLPHNPEPATDDELILNEAYWRTK